MVDELFGENHGSHLLTPPVAPPRSSDEWDSCTWAYRLMSHKNFIVLDTETTGLGSDAEICEIAIIAPDGAALLNTLVKPTVALIEEGAAAIHGIDDLMIESAASFLVLWPQIHDILTSVEIIVTYNADFDRRLLKQSCRAAGLHAFFGESAETLAKHSQAEPKYILPTRWTCCMQMYAVGFGERRYGGGRKWMGLSRAITAQGMLSRIQEAMEPHQAHFGDGVWHRALYDAVATLELIKHLAAMYEVGMQHAHERYGKPRD